MSAVDFTIGRGDTSPPLDRQLQDSDGNGVDLSDAVAVVFNMQHGSTIVIDRVACSITAAATGWVRYEWAAADTATRGTYEGEFEVAYSDGSIETFPNGVRKIRIQITQDIA